MNRPPLSNDTIDSVLRHREVGQAKDLSARPCRTTKIQVKKSNPYIGLERPLGLQDSEASRISGQSAH